MTEHTFTSIRLIDGKQRKVIVDLCKNIINNDPTNEELKDLKIYLSIQEIYGLPEEDKKKYLLDFFRYFYEKEGRVPDSRDFDGNLKYPSRSTIYKI